METNHQPHDNERPRYPPAQRRRSRLSIVGAAVGASLVTASAHALIINPTYNGLSPAAQAEIASAITFYETTFSDPITVDIEFHNMSTGGGQSYTHFYFWTYNSFRQALIADATSPNDISAVLSFTPGPAEPILGKEFISLKSANGRAVGLPTPGLPTVIPGVCNFTGDGCVGLNVSATTIGGGAYSLFAIAEHEINELLGLGSSLQPDGTIFQGYVSPQDMYRYAAAGIRSFTHNPSAARPCANGTPRAFFSIDGGVTNLNEFNNCNNGGDYGDWIEHSPPQVQDAFLNEVGQPQMTVGDSANIALDVVGWTLAVAVPEPLSVAIFATGLVGVAAIRRRR